MRIKIDTKTEFGIGYKVYYLHINEESKYTANMAYVNKIIIEPRDEENFKLYYLLSDGKLIPEHDVFGSESSLWDQLGIVGINKGE